ncbi:oxidoreductase [Enterococcus rotai]|uniref:oxidoreductase n=1 Tax=Enterococcus rotai TaxID=118060 RepID=UPI0032B5E356
MKNFNAFVVRESNGQIVSKIEQVNEEFLSKGEVLIKVHYSSINYKDMLATQNKGGVIRTYPMIPGIDLSGEVVESTDSNYHKGQPVLVTGFGTGVTHTGGFSEYVRVPASWIIPLPSNFSLKDAMIYGTAGLTAALSIQALEKNGLNNQLDHSILVTGATGGVGSIALQILAKIGYKNIIALVRKENQLDIARNLGATEVILLSDFKFEKKPLSKQTFHYILDTVGGDLVANLLPYVFYQGSVSLCGNVGGIKLNSTVLPFILRGVNLLGIDSVNISYEDRVEIWNKLSKEWNVTNSTLVNEIPFEEIPSTISLLKNGTHLGRSIVKIS